MIHSPPSIDIGLAARRTRRGRSGLHRPAREEGRRIDARASRPGLSKFLQNLQSFANSWKARSRLYRNQICIKTMRFFSIFEDLQDFHTSAPLQI